MNGYSSRSNCNVAECFTEKSRCCWTEHICRQGVTCVELQGLKTAIYENIPLALRDGSEASATNATEITRGAWWIT